MTTKQAAAAVEPVRQRTQYSCMATSMMMCLKANGLDTNEDEVNKVMGARPMQGASWEQALACAQHFGMRSTMIVPATVRQLKEWTDRGVPVMIAWNPEGRPWSHASVVFDVDADLNVSVADPNIPDPDETVRKVTKDEFYHKWFEKWPDYLVRRPAMAVEREITPEGRQVVASRPGPHWNPWPQQKAELEGESEALAFMLRYPEHLRPLGVERPGDREKALLAVKHLVEALQREDQGAARRAARQMPESYAQLVSPTVWHFIRTGETKLAKKTQPVAPPKKDKNKIVVEAPTQRNEVMQQWLSQRGHGTGGAGKHHNREYDAEKGRGKGKHKKDWSKEAESAERVTYRYLAASYDGNPDGKSIYQHEIDHGYDEPLAGGTDVMRRLQNQLLKEQGNPQRPVSPEIPKKAFDEAEYDACVAYLNENLIKFPKKSAWWLPAHNCAVNMTLLGGINLWTFSALPMFAAKQAYLPEGDDPVTEPAGIRLGLDWQPHPQYRNETFPATLAVAQKLVAFCRKHRTVGETMKDELKWIETHFGVAIPSSVEAQYVMKSPQIATRRWGINRLKTPDVFIPLDGRKAVPMPSWGRPRMK